MKTLLRREKGFTLIELLIVVAILGVLAAVVIPNVGRFLGKGVEEARRTEFHNLASSVIAMMTDNSLATIPNPITDSASASNLMGDDPDTGATLEGFPDITTTAANKGYTGAGSPIDGYILYKHDRIDPIATANFTTVSYVSLLRTKYYYTCDVDGTLHQYDEPGGTEYKY